MARISEFEVSAADTIELALTADEYNAMIAAGGSISYNAALYQHNGTFYRSFAFPTGASSYQLDPDTNEYISIITYPTSSANFATSPTTGNINYEGVGLYSNTGGTVTPIEGYYLHTSGANPAAYDLTPNDGPMAGSTFGIVNISALPAAGGSGSVRWDFPTPNDPVFGSEDFFNTGILCFAKGTLIETRDGMMDVSDLKPGDQVNTLDNGYQSVKWIGCRKIDKDELKANPKLYPVRISSGSLGLNTPSRDLLVSRQHRVLVNFDGTKSAEALIAAVKLTELPGIYVDDSVENVEYYHVLCENHEVIFAENLQAETLFTGEEALKTLSSEALEEINAILPQLFQAGYQPKPARQLATGKMQKQLVEQHLEQLACN